MVNGSHQHPAVSQHQGQASQQKQLEEQHHDKDLLELLNLLETTTPVIPDALMDYYMIKAGVECDDVRLKRLVALIGQKFVTDVANDAMHYSRLRQGIQSNTIGNRSAPAQPNKKYTLTMEDLTAALTDYGVSIKRPNYYT